MSYNSDVTNNYGTLEYGKFVEIVGDTRFPAVSVTRVQYPESVTMSPVSSTEVYPKYAVLSHIVNSSDLVVTLTAGNVTIGDVGLVDRSTGSSVYGRIIYTNTVGGKLVGALAVSAVGVLPVSAVGVFPVSGNVTVTNPVSSSEITFADTGILDAFGKLRTSTPYTLFDSKTLHDKNSLFWSETAVGVGAAVNFTSETADASVTLSTANVGEYAIRQTRQRFNYQPGKSQCVIFTGVLNPVSNAIKRYGLFHSLTSTPFTPTCGLYFETQTDTPSSIAVVQMNQGGVVPSVSARRENWNIDRLDGTGPSGKTLYLSAANIFTIDYEWLGVGRSRYGFIIDGKICYAHAFNNAGAAVGAYLRTPNLPVRAELRQTGVGIGNLKQICCSVQSEGGSDFTGVVKSVTSSSTALTVATNARRALVGVRLQAGKLDSVNEVINASTICLASNNQNACYRYEILLNPTIALTDGAMGVWTDLTDSNYAYWNWNNVGTQTITGGTAVTVGYGAVGSTIDLSGLRFEKFMRLGCTVNGVRDELYLVVTPLQDNQGVYGSLTFIESD